MENIRNSKEYKEMSSYVACEIAEGFGGGKEATLAETLAAWQYLHDTKQAYSLQGWYGRTAQSLIEQGAILA